MAVRWVDRVPTYPNRVKITPENGSPYYATVERADNPTVTGTPVNAANLNAMQEAAGLTANRTVYVSTAGSDSVGDGSAANPYATIKKALATVPKNLNGFTAMIAIAAGNYSESVTVSGFHGGRVEFNGEEGAVVSVNGLHVIDTLVFYISNINITTTGSSGVYMVNSVVFCDTTISVTGGHTQGLLVSNGASAYIRNAVIEGTTQDAVKCYYGGNLSFGTVSGANSGNGFRATDGGRISFSTNTMTAATLYSTGSGGRIYSGAQTDIPKY